MTDTQTERQSWYGAAWLEFFLAFIAARLLQLNFLPEIGMVVLLPVLWLALHILFGQIFERANFFVIPGASRLDDLFGTNETKK